MKKLLFPFLLLLLSFAPIGKRFFQASFILKDSDSNLRYGTYFFTTARNGFPNRKEIIKLICHEYKVGLSDTNSVAITLTEFKKESDFDKLNNKK